MTDSEIRQRAKALDDAVERRDFETVTAFFSEDCEIEMIGLKLEGREALRKALRWMFDRLPEIRFIPVTIMIEGTIFFEEFILQTTVRRERTIEVRMAEVLIYDADDKVKSLRLYFDRLELGDVFAPRAIERALIKFLIRASVKGLRK